MDRAALAARGRLDGAAAVGLREADAPTVVDVLVAGAGPAGATCAYYLARRGAHLWDGTGLRVALLDKANFPRDKYCGDAWCAPALDILEEMGVLQELQADGVVQNCLCGGFVSPAGHSFIANDRDDPAAQKNMSTRCYAIKRLDCDARIARKAAAQPGVDLVENALVESAKLDDGVWTVRCADGRVFCARLLIAADGAASAIGRTLGLVTSPPQGVAARRYVQPGTHNFKADGVLLYPDYTLPGYVALFRHSDDSIDLGMYLLPGGPAKDSDIADIYATKVLNDPFVSRALGPQVKFSERLKVASLRLGGEARSSGDHVLLVGDAAGQVDPLTGEGIHTGMIGARIAAETAVELFELGQFDAAHTKRYHRRWMAEFGSDFAISAAAGKVVSKAPFLMDAVPLASTAKGGAQGSKFFADFGAVMTGMLPKSTFLRPQVAIPLAFQSARQFWRQYVTGAERNYYTNPGSVLDAQLAIPTSWDAQCLTDAGVQPGCTVQESLADLVFEHTNNGKPPVLVLFGSEYGYSEELARTLAARLSRAGACSPRVLSMEHHSVVDWSQEQLVLAVCSTAGDGEPPSKARNLFAALASLDCPSLRHLHIAILGPGDPAYPQFAQAAKDLRKLFLSAGATELLELHTLKTDQATEADDWLRGCCEAAPTVLPQTLDRHQADYLVDSVELNHHLFAPAIGPSRAKPHVAAIVAKSRLTSTEGGKDAKETWHIEIRVDPDVLLYEPGDALGVQPTNDPALIEAILATVGEAGNRELADWLASRDLRTSLSAHKQHTEEHVLDVLTRDPRRELLDQLGPLLPRYYSIASSPRRDNPNVHLCVAAVRYDLFGRSCSGVASTFLIDRLRVGDPVQVWVQPNSSFRPTSDGMVMFGPGTGLAPFRSFIRDQLPGPAILFFGCRQRDQDFLYREELEAWAAVSGDHCNELVTAFSRENPAAKVYVQDRLAQSDVAERVWDRLRAGAHVYICGEGTNMATQVRRALDDLVTARGHNPTDYLAGRIHIDVWNV